MAISAVAWLLRAAASPEPMIRVAAALGDGHILDSSAICVELHARCRVIRGSLVPAVALVAAHLFANATERSEVCLGGRLLQVLENLSRVCALSPVAVAHLAWSCRQAQAHILLDLTALIDGRGAVDHKGERVI